MKTSARVIIVSTLAFTFLFMAGCSDKPVTPYSASSNTNMPEGKSIDYSGNGQGTITEEIGPSEESLDAAGKNGDPKNHSWLCWRRWPFPWPP